MVIGSRKSKRVSKNSWVCRIRKWAKDAQGSKWAKDVQEEINGTKEPTSNVMGQESPK